MSSTKFLSLGLACSVCSTKRMYSAGSGTLQAGGRQSQGGDTAPIAGANSSDWLRIAGLPVWSVPAGCLTLSTELKF